MTDWSSLLKMGIALFAIVNPIGGLTVFISATEGWEEADRQRIARTVGITVFTVLALAAFVGDALLGFFGIGIPSFQVGGGILILLMAISMLQAKQGFVRQTPEELEAAAQKAGLAVVPLSVPLLAGPGAISSVIIAAEQGGTFWGHAVLVLPVAVVALLVWLIFRVATPISETLGTIGINIVTRLMGLILAAMAVEFMARGLARLFPGLLA